MSAVVIAVDGPAASGKTTAARGVARRLGFHHLSSGMVYRAIAWAALEQGWASAAGDGSDGGAVSDDAAGPDGGDPALDDATLTARLDALRLELVPGDREYGIRVEDESPGRALQSPRVADAASRLSRRQAVRDRVNALVRAEARRRSLVCDGRDAGTAIFPDAPLKVFLVATPEERARRRLEEHGEEATDGRVRREADRLRERDDRDAGRALSPLRADADAVRLDTTELTPDEVVDRIVEEARRRGIATGG